METSHPTGRPGWRQGVPFGQDRGPIDRRKRRGRDSRKGKKANDVDHPDFDREAYRRRNVVERRIGRRKEFRRIFGRFEKTAVNYLAMIRTAFIRLFLSELIS